MSKTGFGDMSLNSGLRNKEIIRILQENEAMLKRLQSRQSTYNVWNWELERKEQVKRVKQICMYPPNFSTKRGRFQKKKRGIDMVVRYSSAGPNKQMYEMYNMSVKQPANAYQPSPPIMDANIVENPSMHE
jgi:hypothetical protein